MVSSMTNAAVAYTWAGNAQLCSGTDMHLPWRMQPAACAACRHPGPGAPPLQLLAAQPPPLQHRAQDLCLLQIRATCTKVLLLQTATCRQADAVQQSSSTSMGSTCEEVQGGCARVSSCIMQRRSSGCRQLRLQLVQPSWCVGGNNLRTVRPWPLRHSVAGLATCLLQQGCTSAVVQHRSAVSARGDKSQACSQQQLVAMPAGMPASKQPSPEPGGGSTHSAALQNAPPAASCTAGLPAEGRRTLRPAQLHRSPLPAP